MLFILNCHPIEKNDRHVGYLYINTGFVKNLLDLLSEQEAQGPKKSKDL